MSADHGIGATEGMGAEKVENLEVKGSYRQSRQVLHYELEHMAKVLGPVRDFMASFRTQGYLRTRYCRWKT